jgi:hypothetical protein
MYYKYIYMTQVYTCYRNTVFYFDTSHSLSSQHVSAYEPLEDTKEVIRLDRKGQRMNTWERFHIYKLSKEGIQLNDTYADSYNPIFKLISNQTRKQKKHVRPLLANPTSHFPFSTPSTIPLIRYKNSGTQYIGLHHEESRNTTRPESITYSTKTKQ